MGLVSLLLQKNIYTQELEITRIERRVLFLELDFLFQGVKKDLSKTLRNFKSLGI